MQRTRQLAALQRTNKEVHGPFFIALHSLRLCAMAGIFSWFGALLVGVIDVVVCRFFLAEQILALF